MKQKKLVSAGITLFAVALVDSADLDGWNRFFCPFFPYDSFSHYALYFG